MSVKLATQVLSESVGKYFEYRQQMDNDDSTSEFSKLCLYMDKYFDCSKKCEGMEVISYDEIEINSKECFQIS